MYTHDWDSMPGELANEITDIESTAKRITRTVDDGDESYTLDDIREDLEAIRDLATKGVQAIRAAAG
jgi:hypothetical protein